MAEELTVYEVFTPSRPARVNFVPRARVNDDLVDAIRTPGTQIVIFGETGSGKSSLLLKKLDELYPDHLTTRCHGTMTFDAVLLDAFDQLDPFFNAGATTGHSSTVRAGLTADFFRVRASVDAAATESGSTSIARVSMQNLGRYKYEQRRWKHRWTPLSHQQVALTPGGRRPSGPWRHPEELWGDTVPLRLHGDATALGGGKFRGRDCIG